jgi:hypothetical protein
MISAPIATDVDTATDKSTTRPVAPDITATTDKVIISHIVHLNLEILMKPIGAQLKPMLINLLHEVFRDINSNWV